MSSREERKEAAKAVREEQQAAALAASRRRRLQLVGGGVAALVLVVVVAAVVLSGGDDDSGGTASGGKAASIPAQQITDLTAAAKAAGVKVSTYKDNGTGQHTNEPVDYPMNPPTNGPHNPVWAADGDYAGRTTPQIEQLVHALEHGRIEIQYRPGLPAEQVAQLEALFDEAPQHVLLFENTTDMKGDVAVTAWTHSMVFPSLTPATFDAIRAFREKYRDQGPEYVA